MIISQPANPIQPAQASLLVLDVLAAVVAIFLLLSVAHDRARRRFAIARIVPSRRVEGHHPIRAIGR